MSSASIAKLLRWPASMDHGLQPLECVVGDVANTIWRRAAPPEGGSAIVGVREPIDLALCVLTIPVPWIGRRVGHGLLVYLLGILRKWLLPGIIPRRPLNVGLIHVVLRLGAVETVEAARILAR